MMESMPVLAKYLYQSHRWLARSLLQAFRGPPNTTSSPAAETAASCYLLPWLYDEVERTQSVMGRDFWPYGLDGQRKGLAYVSANIRTNRDWLRGFLNLLNCSPPSPLRRTGI